jgi:hypothetical protein
MSKAVATLTMLLVVLVVPATVFAQSNGSIYAVQVGAAVPIFFNFSVSGSTFVATILTFGNGGNGRWFAAFGTTDGVNGAGQILSPSGFALTQPANSTLTFQLDQPNGPAGSFTTHGLEGFLSVRSGGFVRIFP